MKVCGCLGVELAVLVLVARGASSENAWSHWAEYRRSDARNVSRVDCEPAERLARILLVRLLDLVWSSREMKESWLKDPSRSVEKLEPLHPAILLFISPKLLDMKDCQ